VRVKKTASGARVDLARLDRLLLPPVGGDCGPERDGKLRLIAVRHITHTDAQSTQHMTGTHQPRTQHINAHSKRARHVDVCDANNTNALTAINRDMCATTSTYHNAQHRHNHHGTLHPQSRTHAQRFALTTPYSNSTEPPARTAAAL
jgi:hypothetical protein